MTDFVKERTLPSGKRITQHFSGGDLVVETQFHGRADIGIKFEFTDGKKIRESYFYNEKLVSRSRYNSVRLKFPDMPAPDSGLPDWGGKFLRIRAQRRRDESRAENRARKSRVSDAQVFDSFCRRVMKRGRKADAVEWIRERCHTLGERKWLASKRLVDRLLSAGCVRVWACQIDEYHHKNMHENTGHLVMELPRRSAARKRILQLVHRLARETGYGGPSDVGQRYAYVKLD